MPPNYRPTFHYADPTLTPPAPGRDLIMKVGLVHSLPGIGPKDGGQYIGIPRAIGPRNTRLWQPYDQVEMTLPNTDVQLWNTPFITGGHRRGVFNLAERPDWHWLRWTIADHVAHDTHDTAAAQEVAPLVIVPCGATKEPIPSPAGQLYRGTYHRLGLRAAAALTGPESVRIMSARHGLLNLHTIVEPYNLRLGQPGAITTDQLRDQAADQGLLDRPDVVLFGGRDYVELAQQVWPHARTPLAGARGIGEQQQRLAAIAAAGHLNRPHAPGGAHDCHRDRSVDQLFPAEL